MVKTNIIVSWVTFFKLFLQRLYSLSCVVTNVSVHYLHDQPETWQRFPYMPGPKGKIEENKFFRQMLPGNHFCLSFKWPPSVLFLQWIASQIKIYNCDFWKTKSLLSPLNQQATPGYIPVSPWLAAEGLWLKDDNYCARHKNLPIFTSIFLHQALHWSLQVFS